MKELTKKQKIGIALVVVILLVVSYFWGYRPNASEETASKEEIARLKEQENEDLKDLKVSEDASGTLTAFSIESDVDVALPGQTVEFKGNFEGKGNYSKQIHWKVEGAESTKTSIGFDGRLKIGEDETAKKLLVKAIPIADETMVRELGITVDQSGVAKADNSTTSSNSTTATTEPSGSLEERAQKAQEGMTQKERAQRDEKDRQTKNQAIRSTSQGPKDKYQTDPTPAGKPKPVEPEDVVIDDSIKKTATISIRCDTILDNLDMFDMDKIDVLPEDGVILPTTKVSFSQGESVFDVLKRVTRDNKIHMESSFTPVYNSAYVEGINNIYEFDCGELSGWMYKVNGWFPNYGCSRYVLEDGDVINWVYTCDLGKDVGDNSLAGN